MPAPSFTIITVTYNLLKDNRGDTFRQAVQSVCDQTYPHIEHVVIDGGSNDGSVALIEELHKAGKITKYISEPDNGIYNAMNKGAALATGDYILYLNSDDYYHDRDGLARYAAALQKTEADFCYSPLRVVSADDVEIGLSRPKPQKVYAGMPFGHPTLAARRTRFQELGKFDESFSIAADYDFILRHFLAGGSGVEVDTSFASFRHGGISGDSAMLAKDMAHAWQKNFGRFDNGNRINWDTAVQQKRLPVSLFLRLARAPDLSAAAKKIARYEVVRSARKGASLMIRGKYKMA